MNMKEFNKVDIASMDTEDVYFETKETIAKQVKRLNKKYKAQNKKEA